jgi:hypothetical protein
MAKFTINQPANVCGYFFKDKEFETDDLTVIALLRERVEKGWQNGYCVEEVVEEAAEPQEVVPVEVSEPQDEVPDRNAVSVLCKYCNANIPPPYPKKCPVCKTKLTY